MAGNSRPQVPKVEAADSPIEALARTESPADGDVRSGAQQAETAVYIAAMSREMAALASRAGLGLVAHLLAMAEAEAEQAADGGN